MCCNALEIAINGFGYDDPPRPLVEEFGWQVDIVVDAMLGTGAKGAPRDGVCHCHRQHQQDRLPGDRRRHPFRHGRGYGRDAR